MERIGLSNDVATLRRFRPKGNRRSLLGDGYHSRMLLAMLLPLFRTSHHVIAGGAEALDSTAVVGILDGVTNAQCTGTLIAPNVVLTARHCVSSFSGVGCDATWDMEFDPARLYVTTWPSFTGNESDYRRAERVAVDSSVDERCGGDVAIIVLTESVPAADAEPIAPRVDEAVEVGEPYAAVGYGGTDDQGAGAGIVPARQTASRLRHGAALRRVSVPEALPPPVRQQLVDRAGGVVLDSQEHVGEPVLRVDVVRDAALEDGARPG
jgi:hypothetical protein